MSTDRLCPARCTLILGLSLGLLSSAHEISATVLPSELAAIGSGDLVIIDPQHGLFKLSPGQKSAQRLTDLPALGGVDIASIPHTSELLFATYSTETGRTRLYRLTASGRVRGTWELPARLGLLAGVVLAQGGDAAYLSSSRTSEIYFVDFATTTVLPHLVTTVEGAATLTAITLDPKRRELFVADSVSGAVYAIPAAGGMAVKVLANIGEPVALAVDPTTDRLFVADHRSGKVWTIALDKSPASAKLFAQPRDLLELGGLAIDAAGQVWVGDHKSGKVLHFSREGQLLSTYTP